MGVPDCICEKPISGKKPATGVAFPWKEEDGNYKRLESRPVTDRVCCHWFVVTFFILVGILAWSVVKGDIRLQPLLHGIDYEGNICGVSAGFETRKYLYYCGTKDWEAGSAFPKKLDYASKTCVETCPTSADDKVPCLARQMVDFRDKGEDTSGAITYKNTLFLDITQSVTDQKGYPSMKIEDKYCVPNPDGVTATTQPDADKLQADKDLASALRTGLEQGPLSEKVRIATATASFWSGWWIVVVCALLTVFCNWLWIILVQDYAGIIVFLTMGFGCFVTFVFGLFFALTGILLDASNDQGTFNLLNPIFQLSYGVEANLMSLTVGLVLVAAGVCLLFNIMNQKIDESMGIIYAATTAMSSNPLTFLGQPILGSIFMTVLVILLLYGYFLATTVRDLNTGLIEIEDETTYTKGNVEVPIGGLQAAYEQAWWWQILLKIYVLGAVWLCLFCLAIGNFMSCFTVCEYFFTEGQEADHPELSKYGEAVKKAVGDPGAHKAIEGVEVRNAGGFEGPRKTAYKQHWNGQEFLVVPVGPLLPNGREFHKWDMKILKKEMKGLTWMPALRVAIGSHLGSLAVSAWVTTATEPFRVLSMILKSFVGDSSYMDEDTGCKNLVIGGLGLGAALIDEFFGMYSKTMYNEIVLGAWGFADAPKRVNDFVTQAGGNVALLSGSTAIYEWVAVVAITSFVTFVAFGIAQGLFSGDDKVSVGLIVSLTSVLSFLISSLFMSLFDTTCNTLLYTFAWCRKVHGSTCLLRPGKENEKKKILPKELEEVMKKELDIAPKDTLKAQGKAIRQSKHAHGVQKYQMTLRKAWQETNVAARFKRPNMMEQLPLLSTGRS